MTKNSIVFFGSFQHYSTKVLQALHEASHIDVMAVVTTPPREVKSRGKKRLIKTHVHQYAEKVDLPIFTPEKLNNESLRILDSRFMIHDSQKKSVDFFVVAGYSQLLTKPWLDYPKITPLNLHFSLLPRWRGANPAEWAILSGDKQTGVTLIKMDDDIDTGPILTQEKLPIKPVDTRETLYENLYDLAAKMIVKYLASEPLDLKSAKPQPSESPTPYASRLQRQDGFIPWPLIQKAIQGENVPQTSRPGIFSSATGGWPQALERATRALAGFPGLWTKVTTSKGQKRLKILQTHPKDNLLVLDQVQLEGSTPSPFSQINNQLT